VQAPIRDTEVLDSTQSARGGGRSRISDKDPYDPTRARGSTRPHTRGVQMTHTCAEYDVFSHAKGREVC